MSWYVDEEDDSQRRPVDDTVQKTLLLVQEHETTLRLIERAVGDTIEALPDEYSAPVAVNLCPQERVLSLELIDSGKEEKFFKKVLAVFAYLCDEIHELNEIADSTFYPKIIMFGKPTSGIDDESLPTPGRAEEQMGNMLPFLQELSNFVERCHNCAVNMVQQLAKLYNGREKLFQSTFQYVHLLPVYESLSQLLGILVTLDASVTQNSHMAPAWSDYKRMMQFVRDKPDSYGADEATVQRFERVLVQLDASVLRGATFKACIELDFEELVPTDEDGGGEAETVNVRNNPHMLNELFHCLRSKIDRADSAIGTHAETTERRAMVGYVALYALYRRLTPAYSEPDAKFYRRLWSLQSKLPVVVLCGKLVWMLPEFLEEFARLDVKKLEPAEPALARRGYLERLDHVFPATVRRINLEVTAWSVEVEHSFSASARHSGDPVPLLEMRGSLLLRGLVLANKVGTLVKTLVNMHLALGVPMQRKVLRPLCMCVELLKTLEFSLVRKGSVVAESMPHIHRILSARILKLTRPIRAKLQASRKFDDHKMDVLAAVNVIESLLHGSETFSFSRQSVLSLSLCVCLNPNIVKESELEGAFALFKRIKILANWQPSFRAACSCSFLYWNKELLPTFIADVLNCPTEANRLQYIAAAFCDASHLLRSVQHEADNSVHLAAFKKFMVGCLEEGVVKPLCGGVEEDLRLRIHSKTQGVIDESTFNPKKRPPKALRPFLDLKPIRVLGSTLDIRQKVTHYLESVFYNLTTVALYDWMTYADMRNLAAEKYGIEIADNHLPMGSLEYDQGLDVLMIMRNIHVFVARFSYNLNQQNFVERRPDRGSKNLNTINIQSIAASLRQHGLGILNTTVNFTYQFLAQKFHVFSQFLFDEYIKGHLGKERRWFRKHKAELNNQYPYDRALKFVKDIRKLGVLDNGRTFLDQFRILITEIGNALGYVRMVRSAGMLFCSEAVRFLPDLDTMINFEEFSGTGNPGGASEDDGGDEATMPTEGAGLSEGTVRAAANLDDVAGTLASNFSEGSDYFKVLVTVFQQVLLSGDHSHLDNFYMIVPALCLSWVDASYQARSHMYKANRQRDTYYTDDGFAVGLAYIMAILNQGSKFDSIHWFQCMREKLVADSKAISEKKAQQAAAKAAKAAAAKKSASSRSMFSRSSAAPVEKATEEEEEAVHTLQQGENKLLATRRENDLLFFSLSGARIFFKR